MKSNHIQNFDDWVEDAEMKLDICDSDCVHKIVGILMRLETILLGEIPDDEKKDIVSELGVEHIERFEVVQEAIPLIFHFEFHFINLGNLGTNIVNFENHLDVPYDLDFIQFDENNIMIVVDDGNEWARAENSTETNCSLLPVTNDRIRIMNCVLFEFAIVQNGCYDCFRIVSHDGSPYTMKILDFGEDS